MLYNRFGNKRININSNNDQQRYFRNNHCVYFLERFWELEETSTTSEEYEEDRICLELFKKTTEVDTETKIVVNLPIREDN